MHTGGARARSPICKPPPPACSQSDGACAHASDPRSLAEALSFSPLHFSKGPAWRAALVWFRAVCSLTILNASSPPPLCRTVTLKLGSITGPLYRRTELTAPYRSKAPNPQQCRGPGPALTGLGGLRGGALGQTMGQTTDMRSSSARRRPHIGGGATWPSHTGGSHMGARRYAYGWPRYAYRGVRHTGDNSSAHPRPLSRAAHPLPRCLRSTSTPCPPRGRRPSGSKSLSP